ncbi:MAG: hypothetical protein O2960_27490 [Verrucomicrobia bacterium]|nr:hypothetical protein [Verrucomicrobiota bacterium]
MDRIGLFEVFWRETAVKWAAEGHFAKPEEISDHFGLDVRRTGGEITPENVVAMCEAVREFGKYPIER